MPSRRAFPQDLPNVFIGSEAVEAELLSSAQLRGPQVRQVLHGVYRPIWVHESHALRCAAAALVLPGGAAVTGRSAVTVQGLPLADARDDIEVVVPPHVRGPRISGVSVRVSTAPLVNVVVQDGVPLAEQRRVGFDLAARYPLPRGTAHLDAAARHGLIDLHVLSGWLLDCHDNDVINVRAAVAQADPRAESIPESETRVILRGAGFPVVVQYVVHHGKRRLIRADLALPELRIAILYDGAWHALRSQLETDRRQLRELREAGWIAVHVTASLLRSPRELVAAVQAAVNERTAAA